MTEKTVIVATTDHRSTLTSILQHLLLHLLILSQLISELLSSCLLSGNRLSPQVCGLWHDETVSAQLQELERKRRGRPGVSWGAAAAGRRRRIIIYGRLHEKIVIKMQMSESAIRKNIRAQNGRNLFFCLWFLFLWRAVIPSATGLVLRQVFWKQVCAWDRRRRKVDVLRDFSYPITADVRIISNWVGCAWSNLAPRAYVVCLAMDELLKKDVGQHSRFYAMPVSCGQAP
jgi:hypothetical protein